MNLSMKAMLFARQRHAEQRRKYTNNPYFEHLAEVAGIVSAATQDETTLAIAWLHDCIEDQGVDVATLRREFDDTVAFGVLALSDLEEGNRAERKRLSRERLAKAPAWVQTVKVADLISNTASIVQHDPKFAAVYLQEKRLVLDEMNKADQRLMHVARELVAESLNQLTHGTHVPYPAY